jgi:imidazolonepropionase-like amidohydrolase
MKIITTFLLLVGICGPAGSIGFVAQGPTADRQQFIRVQAPVVVLTHVRIIDGTGAPALDDQTIVIADGKIQSIGASGAGAPANLPPNAQTVDLRGYTALPGIVGMHNHMFFPMGGSPPMYSNMGISFPRLYLALGVTTIRTTGSVAPFTDLEIKRLIDAGRMIGPKMHITAPYLEGRGSFTPVMHELTGPEDARRMISFWADQGATSFKAYMNITRAELRAAVEEAHKRGLKVTGHLCSIGYREAAEIGIDNLEHGLLADSEFVPNKQPDRCPGGAVGASLRQLDLNSPAARHDQYAGGEECGHNFHASGFEAGSAPLAQSGSARPRVTQSAGAECDVYRCPGAVSTARAVCRPIPETWRCSARRWISSAHL